MLGRSFLPALFARNFKGVNCKDASEQVDDGEWHEDSINVYSDPQGALGSRPGFSALTTASIGSATAWCGFYQFDKHAGGSTTPYYIGGGSDGKLYNYASNAYSQIYTGLATTDGIDARYSFFALNNQVIIAHAGDAAIAWSGTGSAATFATSITADWGLEWQRYGWLHSTVDPRLIYYCTTLGDPDTAYTSFLNFDMDGEKVMGACKQSDDLLVGKQNGLYRVQYRGTTPLFKIYKVPSKTGPVSHFTMKEIPDGRVIFLAPDCNFYMANGDTVTPCGDNIQKYIQKGVFARLKYAVSGLMYNRSQYWCSFSYTSGATQNDRTLVMDWSRPYADKWGKIQFPWFIYSIGANCFAEVTVSGQSKLYHGGYTGKMYKNDVGTNDNGVAFNSTYKSRLNSFGDPTLEKKFENMALSYQRKGDWNLNIQVVCDGNANTEKNIEQNMLGGLGYQTLWDNFNWDEGYWSSESDIDTTREICRQGKQIQVSMGTTGLDESWLVYMYGINAKGLRRGIRTRES
jgi:hypothetical protein